MTRLILMATYNGAAYLPAQLESILSQTHGWQLLVRDDGSRDRTVELLRARAAAGAPLTLVDDGNDSPVHLGARDNFARLLQKAAELGAEYCALSDQDDVWLAGKLSRQLTHMKALEKKFPAIPILLHADLEVVNRNLERLHPSFMVCQGIRHEKREPLRVLLCQNFVTGSTVMINRSLLQLALPIPGEALMHDWWLALCAAAFGRLEFLDQPLVKYRQHHQNEIGVKNFRRLLQPRHRNWSRHWRDGAAHLEQSFLQARKLAEVIAARDPGNPWRRLVEEYAGISSLSPGKKILKLKELGIHMQSPVRQVLLLSRLLFAKKRYHPGENPDDRRDKQRQSADNSRHDRP